VRVEPSASVASLSRMRSRLVVAFLFGFLALFSCQAGPDETSGGETHFLRKCRPNDGSCAPGLSCICDMCTVPCTGQTECSPFAAAQCTTPTLGSCANAEVPSICGVACARDQDCAVVSAVHGCFNGLCREEPSQNGSGGERNGTGGEGGGPSEPSSGGSGESSGGSSQCDDADVEANEIVILGDSFFAASHQVVAYLEDLGRNEGFLIPGDRYRDYSRLTRNALALSGNGIAEQYQSAQEESPVRVVIMNGGGADVVLGSCDPVDADCPMIVAARDAFAELLTAMSADEIEHVVFVGYPDPVPSAARAKMEALRPLLESACAESAVPCLWVDLRATFEDRYPDYVQSDGLNPTSLGSEAAAKTIAKAMNDRCIPR
jgi:hypothetical protein